MTDVPVGAGNDRAPECVANWPECEDGGYDPRCCRFPKSCSCSLPGAGGGHTADSETEEAIATLEWVIACVPNLDRFTKGKAALARLEAAANRTAEAERLLHERSMLAIDSLAAAEAERDAALAALREIADFGVSAISGEKAVLVARAVLGGPE